MNRLLLALVVASGLASAQPQGRVIWSHHGTDGIYSVVPLQDLDADSLPEVVAAIYYGNYPSDPRKVYCLSGASGDSLWIADTSSAYGTWGNKGLAVSEDVTGDDIQDVILGTVGTYIPPGRSCILLDGTTGEDVWVFPFGEDRGWCYGVKPFVDIDGDTVPDVLAAAGGTTANRSGTAILLSGASGDSIWAFRPPFDGAQCIAPLADVNADSVPDVAVGAGGNGLDNRVFCISGATGAQVWSFQTDNSIWDVAPIDDVNGSGTDDCVAGGWADSVYCIEGSGGSLIWAYPTNQVVMEIVPVQDLDGDAISDAIVGSWSSSVHVLSGADGTLLWSGYVGADVWSVDSLSDVTGDSIPEVVAGCLGSGSGVVKVFDGSSGSPLWQYGFAERVYDVTGMPDLDGDGWADVAVGLQDHGNQADHIYCFSGPPPTALAGRARPTPAPNPLRYRPADRSLTLQVPPGTGYELSFIDICGRRAGTRVTGVNRGTATEATAVQCPPDLSAGTYFARLTLTGGQNYTLKFTLPTASQP